MLGCYSRLVNKQLNLTAAGKWFYKLFSLYFLINKMVFSSFTKWYVCLLYWIAFSVALKRRVFFISLFFILTHICLLFLYVKILIFPPIYDAGNECTLKLEVKNVAGNCIISFRCRQWQENVTHFFYQHMHFSTN